MKPVKTYVEELLAAIRRTKEATGELYVKTGLAPLDYALSGGWSRQNVTYLLGDSGKGKSWMASWMFLAALEQLQLGGAPPPSTEQGYVKPPIVVFWSMEMGSRALLPRMIVQLAHKLRDEQVDYRVFLEGRLCRPGDTEDVVYGEEEKVAINSAVRTAVSTLMNEQGELGHMEFDAARVDQFRPLLDELSEAHDVVLIVIDQFARIGSEFPNDSMSEGQEEKTKALRAIARDYDCHVMSVLNINRQGQQAGHVRASHIWGGVHVQYDADALLILEWKETYEERSQIPEELEVELTLAKNRMGTEGRVQLFFNRPTGMFTLTQKDYDAAERRKEKRQAANNA